MYASNPNAIGSLESLTVEISNELGSRRLIIRLPFEARRFEFSLPGGEAALDGSNEAEVPVLRRVIDEFEERTVRVRSLPTVIKEVCIARFGGVRSRSEWFSARATLEPTPLPAMPEWFPEPEAEVGEAVPASGGEPVLVADGGTQLDERMTEVNELSRFEEGDEIALRYTSITSNTVQTRRGSIISTHSPESDYIESNARIEGHDGRYYHAYSNGRVTSMEPSDSPGPAEWRHLATLGRDGRFYMETDNGEPVLMTDGGQPPTTDRDGYENLQELYADLIERHESLKDEVSEAENVWYDTGEVDDEIRYREKCARRRECIEIIQHIESVLNTSEEESDL